MSKKSKIPTKQYAMYERDGAEGYFALYDNVDDVLRSQIRDDDILKPIQIYEASFKPIGKFILKSVPTKVSARKKTQRKKKTK